MLATTFMSAGPCSVIVRGRTPTPTSAMTTAWSAASPLVSEAVTVTLAMPAAIGVSVSIEPLAPAATLSSADDSALTPRWRRPRS